MSPNLNLTHLLNFVQIVEWRNVSQAAAYLNIAQPALSRQIQSLENTLNTRLLRRYSWGVEPTEDGKLLLEHARRIHKECISLQESVRSNKLNPAGSVFLGVPAAYAITIVPPLLQRMRELYPNIIVHVIEAFSGTIYEWLISERLDLALLYHPDDSKTIESEHFIKEEMVALGNPDQFKGISSFNLSDLSDRRVISAWRPHIHRLTLDATFVELGVPFKPYIEIDSLPCMKELASRGDGIAILPQSTVTKELKEGRLSQAALEPSIKLSTLLGRPSKRQPTRSVQIVSNTLKQLAKELAPSTGWEIYE